MSDALDIIAQNSRGGLSWIVCREYSSGSARARLDRLAPNLPLGLSSGFANPLGRGWRDEPVDVALHRLNNWRASAKDDIFIRTRADYRSIKTFASYFTDSARAFCNREQISATASAHTPMSPATFDFATGLVEGDLVGILCVQLDV